MLNFMLNCFFASGKLCCVALSLLLCCVALFCCCVVLPCSNVNVTSHLVALRSEVGFIKIAITTSVTQPIRNLDTHYN